MRTCEDTAKEDVIRELGWEVHNVQKILDRDPVITKMFNLLVEKQMDINYHHNRLLDK